MKYGERDGSGRFAKKEVLGNNATQDEVTATGTAETPVAAEIETQVGTTVTTETTTTVIYSDSIEEVGADVEKFLALLGITGVGATVDKALRIAGVGTEVKETTSEPANP